jgi:hypothetical protein
MKKPGKAALARARALYDEGVTPLAKIAAALGLTPAAFRALRKRDNWPERRAAAPKLNEPATPQASDEQVDTFALERRLARALRREIARAESEIEKDAAPGAERKARVLGLLVRTLGDLRKLGQAERGESAKSAEDESHDEIPRDMATLRAALVKRLERLRGSRDAG